MKRKTVQTKYDVPVRRAFRWASEQQSCSAEASMIVRIPAPWLTKEIIFVCTVFLSFTLWMTCERTFIHAQSTLWIAPQNLQFTLWDSRLWKNRCQLLFFFTQLFVYGLCVTIRSAFLYNVINLLNPGDRFL